MRSMTREHAVSDGLPGTTRGLDSTTHRLNLIDAPAPPDSAHHQTHYTTELTTPPPLAASHFAMRDNHAKDWTTASEYASVNHVVHGETEGGDLMMHATRRPSFCACCLCL